MGSCCQATKSDQNCTPPNLGRDFHDAKVGAVSLECYTGTEHYSGAQKPCIPYRTRSNFFKMPIAVKTSFREGQIESKAGTSVPNEQKLVRKAIG